MKKLQKKGHPGKIQLAGPTLEEAFYLALHDPFKIDGRRLSDSERALYFTLEARHLAARGEDTDAENLEKFYAGIVPKEQGLGFPITASRMQEISDFYARKAQRKIIPFIKPEVQP